VADLREIYDERDEGAPVRARN